MALKHRNGSRKRYRDVEDYDAIAKRGSGGEFESDHMEVDAHNEGGGDALHGIPFESDLEHVSSLASSSEPSEADESDRDSVDVFSGLIDGYLIPFMYIYNYSFRIHS